MTGFRSISLITRRKSSPARAASRPLLWLNTSMPFLWGAVGLRGRLEATDALLFAYFLFPYNYFLHAPNDYFDFETDARNPRKGSAEGARATEPELRRLVALSCALVATFAIFFAAVGNFAATIVLAVLLAVSWAYSAPPLRLKGRPGWDSLANAAYVLPFVFAALLLGVDPVPWRAIAAFALWAIASHALTSIQDVDADRASGLETIATALGRRRAALLLGQRVDELVKVFAHGHG